MLSKAKIGYLPHTEGMLGPGDRRRFCFYTEERKIPFEQANVNSHYDLVYLTSSSNISEWLEYKKKYPSTQIIFELIDSYLFESTTHSLSKGFIRWIRGKERKWFLNYQKAYQAIFKAADAVVCSDEEQKKIISNYNRNVHISLDYFGNDLTVKKSNYQKKTGKVKLVWEGQAFTLSNLLMIKDILIKKKDFIELTVITDEEVKYPISIFNKKSSDILSQLGIPVRFVPWEKRTFAQEFISHDVAIIPVDTSNPQMNYKPANKLLLCWESGMPTIVSATPAYQRWMQQFQLPFACRNSNDWEAVIDECIQSSDLNETFQMNSTKQNLEQFRSKERILNEWDAIFNSIPGMHF